ncbi:MAG TPA: hypothetical protein VK809_02835, partial [Bacteroidia bacterium]|nr:hypothetical protein [Bacteroidia bacterium]
KMHHPKTDAPIETTTILHDRTKGEIFLVKTLGLDTIQQKKLEAIQTAHFSFLDKNMSAYIRNQNNLFDALKNNNDTAYVARCADSLGMFKVAMEKELYTNFAAIKAICTSDQQKKFNDLIDNMSKEFLHHHDFHNSGKTSQDSL